MNCRISNDLKNLLPNFSVIAYEIDFDSDFDAMNKSKEVDEYLAKIDAINIEMLKKTIINNKLS